jgi:hypothetical protein
LSPAEEQDDPEEAESMTLAEAWGAEGQVLGLSFLQAWEVGRHSKNLGTWEGILEALFLALPLPLTAM